MSWKGEYIGTIEPDKRWNVGTRRFCIYQGYGLEIHRYESDYAINVEAVKPLFGLVSRPIVKATIKGKDVLLTPLKQVGHELFEYEESLSKLSSDHPYRVNPFFIDEVRRCLILLDACSSDVKGEGAIRVTFDGHATVHALKPVPTGETTQLSPIIYSRWFDEMTLPEVIESLHIEKETTLLLKLNEICKSDSVWLPTQICSYLSSHR